MHWQCTTNCYLVLQIYRSMSPFVQRQASQQYQSCETLSNTVYVSVFSRNSLRRRRTFRWSVTIWRILNKGRLVFSVASVKTHATTIRPCKRVDVSRSRNDRLAAFRKEFRETNACLRLPCLSPLSPAKCLQPRFLNNVSVVSNKLYHKVANS